MSDKLSKSEQLYELARHVLPYLGRTVYISGRQYHLRISRRKAEYVSSGDVLKFTGRTTLEACQKMLEWYNRRDVLETKNTKTGKGTH